MKANLVIAIVGIFAIAVVLVCGFLLYQRTHEAEVFEYRVCLLDESRITFVNGVWQGNKPMDKDDPEGSRNSCPTKWDYLVEAGAEGWELVAVVPLSHLHDQFAQELFLRRRGK